MDNIKDLLKTDNKQAEKIAEKHKYVTKEYQDYGYRIALKLEDLKKVSMYIKWAKEKPRALMEQAYSFAIDYPNARNRGRLFMWKMKDLEAELKEKRKEEKLSNSDTSVKPNGTKNDQPEQEKDDTKKI